MSNGLTRVTLRFPMFRQLVLVIGVFASVLSFSRQATAESVTDCVNRCQTICGYFPNNPECQRQSDRCVVRCKRGKGG
jgi:hypothetical protein